MAQTNRPARRNHPAGTYNMGYVDGNTVRKLAPDPYERKSREEERERIRQERERARREEKRKNNQKIAIQNREKVLKLDLKYTLFLAIAVAATLLICIYYLSLQSQLTAQTKSISSLKSELNALTDENLATQERINNAIDLEKVYEVAKGELGMDYATKGQIIYYSGTSDDYVKQYKEIPQSK